MTSQALQSNESESNRPPCQPGAERDEKSVQGYELKLLLTAKDIRWSRRVTDSRGDLFQLGITLGRAKSSLGAVRFNFLLQAGVFGVAAKQANRLMRIVATGVLANPQYHSMLPTCERTLLELAKVEADKLEEAIRTGQVHREMTFEEASEFATKNRNQEPVVSDESLRALKVNSQAAGLAYYILEEVSHWPASEQQRASELLATLSQRIGQASEPNWDCRLI